MYIYSASYFSFAGHLSLAIVVRADGKIDRELPFAFNDAFGCSMNRAALANGIMVPKHMTAFSARINNA
jgi:hypothetical protein